MPDKNEILDSWERRIVNRHRAHSRASAQYEKYGNYLGISATILSTIVGTSVFASLESSPSVSIKIIVGILSIGAAVISVLHTKFNFSGIAQKHNVTSKKFGDLRRNLERIRISAINDTELNEELLRLDNSWGEIRENALTVPQKIWDKATQANNVNDDR
jgi:hypothetical protein